MLRWQKEKGNTFSYTLQKQENKTETKNVSKKKEKTKF